MDERLKRRIVAFYAGGIINALLGLYVVVEGLPFLPAETERWLAIGFLAFAAVDFYFAHALKRKWLADNAGKQTQDNGPSQRT